MKKKKTNFFYEWHFEISFVTFVLKWAKQSCTETEEDEKDRWIG